MDPQTVAIRSLITTASDGTSMTASPVFAAPFHLSGDPDRIRYTYGRYGNPTWSALEGALSSLECSDGIEVRSLVFASGMAAATAIFGTFLRPGNAVVIPSTCYYTVRTFALPYLRDMGIEVRIVDLNAVDVNSALAGAALLWLESPSNPGMEIVDIRALSRAARNAGAYVAVDNTTVTSVGQSVLVLGAHIAVVSGTKILGGHGDLLLGHVAVTEEDLWIRLKQWRSMTGAVAGPMEAWLALRSLSTLPFRLERSSANALAAAHYLEARSDVLKVMYPGLDSHPGHSIAAAQMAHFGPVVSFVLESERAADAFLERSRLFSNATSFGGIASTAERRGRWGGDDIAPGFIRASLGCEAEADLIADLGFALDPAA